MVKTTSKPFGAALSVRATNTMCFTFSRDCFNIGGVMIDSLVMDPLKGESVRKLVGYSHALQLATQTEVIPDEILGPLVRGAIEYVDRFAGYLLEAGDAVEDIRDRGRNFFTRSNRYVREHRSIRLWARRQQVRKWPALCCQLNKELCYLQTACFVVIAFATGMRVSEILSLQVGCCETQKEPGQADLVWLRSRVFKMQGVPEGRSARWLGDPSAPRPCESWRDWGGECDGRRKSDLCGYLSHLSASLAGWSLSSPTRCRSG